jgi:chromosome partitioning protein
MIPRNVRISEAPSYALPVLNYDPNSKGSESYRALAREIGARYGLVQKQKGHTE